MMNKTSPRDAKTPVVGSSIIGSTLISPWEGELVIIVGDSDGRGVWILSEGFTEMGGDVGENEEISAEGC